jgi:peptide/nickel transport system ATP-binding protein
MQTESPLPVILQVKNLSVDYKTPFGNVHALRNVSLSVREGEVLSVVGESGSGKSTLALAIARLLSMNSTVLKGGKLFFRGTEIEELRPSKMDLLRGTEIFMIFQNPFMSLNPLMKIKDQILEALRVRNKREEKSDNNAKLESEVVSVLKSVRIGDAQEVMERYPHQLSGGQNQRIMISMALALNPKLLIADEPTSALDVVTQKQIMELLLSLKREFKLSVLFITHDLAIAGSISDRIAVLYGGMVQEVGTSQQILSDPKHPYTASLIKSIPSKSKDDGPLEAIKGSFSISGVEKMCAFAPRCPLVRDSCERRVPALIGIGNERFVRCVIQGEAEEDARI